MADPGSESERRVPVGAALLAAAETAARAVTNHLILAPVRDPEHVAG